MSQNALISTKKKKAGGEEDSTARKQHIFVGKPYDAASTLERSLLIGNLKERKKEKNPV